MATQAEWKKKIGARIQELRDLKGWSLADLARKTDDELTKSQISNYEQGSRMPGPKQIVILAKALDEAAAHVYCLDDDMPALSKDEAQLIRDLRELPGDQRAQYMKRIALLASAYKEPVPNERLLDTEYNPGKRPKVPKAQQKRPAGRHDQ